MEGKEKLKILIFSWRGPGHPNAGGAEISTHEHAKGWVKKGHIVTLFTSYHPGAKREEMIDGVNIIRRGRQIFGVHWEAFKWYLFAPHQKFDLVVDQFHGIPFFTPIFVRQKKLGFIHEVTKEVWRLSQWPIPFNFMVAILGLLEPMIFWLYKNVAFMTVSDSTKQDLVNWGIPPNNINVVHNGLDVPAIKNSIPKEKKKTLIYLGALSKDKGIEEALRIFSLLENRSHNWQFWVVGKGEGYYLKKLKLQSTKLGIEKKVRFWGFVKEEKKFDLLSRAHLLINTSVREGWGLVVMEAASVGTPTVAFNVPGLRDSIINGKTGIIDKQNSVNSMADEIIDLLNDFGRYQKMREEAVKWSKGFSWEESIIKSLNLINKITNS